MNAVSAAMVDSLPCGVVQLDAQDRVVVWNEMIAQWSGLNREAALGQSLIDLFPGEGRITRSIALVRRSGSPRILSQIFHGYLIPVPLPAQHGSGFDRMQQECHVIPLDDPPGHLAITILDVTPAVVGRQRARQLNGDLRLARENAERALRDRERLYATSVQREERYRSMVDNLREVVFQTDLQGQWTFLNPVWTELIGVPIEETLGTDCLSYVLPEDREKKTQELNRLEASGTAYGRYEVRYLTPDGGFRWIEEQVHAAFDREGKQIGWAGTLNDVTERHASESALVAARDGAQAASRAKSEFMAKMSHEIRTPLNGVLGFADLLLDSSLDEQQRESAFIIRESGSALLAIINDILDFSKIEAGRLEIDKLPFDPDPIIVNVLKLFEASVRKSGVRLSRCDPPNGLPTLLGDAGRFRQILTNLVGNAVKFTERGEVSVAVSLQPSAESGPMLRLAVRDTGIGIPADKQSLLFQEFSQVDGSTTRKYGGTGLGLAICKRLAEMMGGAIGCESESGSGSTFWFTMPVAALVASSGSERAAKDDAATTKESRMARPGLKVLLVEDNRTNRLLAVRMLSRLGCAVEVAVHGAEALRIVQEKSFYLVFMDCHMPEMDGFEAIHAIR